MSVLISFPEQLQQFLDKPIRVYYHGGELLAVGTFHGVMHRIIQGNGTRVTNSEFILYFGASNWELRISDPFPMHDIRVEEILPILPCFRCKRLHTIEQYCNLPNNPPHSLLCPDDISDFPHHHI